MKTLTLSLITTLFVLTMIVSCKQDSSNLGSADLKKDSSKTYYAMGVLHAKQIQKMEFAKQDRETFAKGYYHMLMEEKLQISEKEIESPAMRQEIQKIVQSKMKIIQEKYRKEMMTKSGPEKEKGSKFLNDFVKKEKATLTKSGLAYKIIKKGKGKKPKAEDKVKVHYKGTLISGKEFDSSYKRDKPASFALNRVIKGWTEGIQKVREGGKIKLVIPSHLGYGDAGSAGAIPAGATLVFEVELIKILKK
jgi:FKBP-type peptidyl-prolyl cis-trans isomerase